MMQGIVNRGRGLGADGDGHSAGFSLSSARSLPVRGQRGGGWTAWEELASLADADGGDEAEQLTTSLLPTGQIQGRTPLVGLARTLYSDLESSRSENARGLYAPQPMSAWSELQSSRHDPTPLGQLLRAAGSEVEAGGLSGLHQTAARHAPAQQSSQRNGHSMSSQGLAARQRSASPAHRAPSPQLRSAVESNQIAMAQGADDFLSASQGYLREYNRLARLGLAQGNLRIAEENLTQAIELAQQGDMSGTEVAAVTYNLLGCMYRRMGRLNEAVDYLHRSLHVLEIRKQGGEPLVERDVDVADVHMNMSSAQSALNRHDVALDHVKYAIALLSERLGISEGQGWHEAHVTLSSEQDSKDVRMLAIAHYNRGAEMRTLKQEGGGIEAFEAAMGLADRFLPPGDSLRAMIKKAHRRASGVQRGGQGMAAPPGVTPLRLSELQASGQQSNTFPDKTYDNTRPKQQQHPISDTPSHRSTSSMGSMRTPRLGRSQLTPQGWHKLHAVHCGNFASSARRSARGDNPDDANKQPRVTFTTTQIQTGLVPVTQETEIRATLPRNVFQRGKLESTAKHIGAQEVIVDENDEVLGLAQQYDILTIFRADSDGGVVNAASRYVPQEGGANAKGLLDYSRSLEQSRVKTKRVCESGTQVEHEYLHAHESALSGEGGGQGVRLKSLPGGWRRENVEQTVEEMVSKRARDDIRGRSIQAAGAAWDLRSGSVDSVGGAHRPHGAHRPQSMDRTYRSHLQRTREAHLRYNKVALVLQMAYRCHMARLVTVNLQRNPRHLKAMLAKQIHAFAALLQSNMRCMLAKRRVAKQASRRIMSAEDRWRARRNRASLVIQSWFCEVVQSRLLARRFTSAPNAASCLQRAFRCYQARSYLPQRVSPINSLATSASLCELHPLNVCARVLLHVCDAAGFCLKTEKVGLMCDGCRRKGEHMRANNVHRIIFECQQLESSCVSIIQRAFRCCGARRKFNEEKCHCEVLRLQPGTMCLWRGAQHTLTAPQLDIALKQQAWAVVKLQQSLLSCLLHREWLYVADDFKRRTRDAEAERIQCAWRHKRACRTAIAAICHHDLERKHHQVQLAASLIQRAMLGKWARKRRGNLQQKALIKVVIAATIDVQRVWYGHAARNWVRNKIHLADLERHNQHRHQELALRLQLGMRCFWARREMTDRYWTTKSKEASIKIQCAARVFLARNEFQVHVLEEVQRRKTSAVLHLQAFNFSNSVFRTRPLIRFWQERRETSATILAAVYKAHLVRLDMQDLRLEKYQVVCATSLQRIFRAHHARVVARQRLRLVTRDYQYAAALRLQTAMRSKWARVSMQRVGMLHTETYRLRREAQLTRKIQATRMLQAMLRSYLARELVLLPELAMRQAQCALLLSRIYRGHIGRRLFERRCYEKEMEGALKIQGAYRLHLARLLLRRTVEQHRIASLLSLAQRQQRGAAIIQHAYFMHVCRLKLKDRAAQVMMCMMLRCMASVKYRSGLAASTVQAALRRHKSRRKLQVALAADSLRAHMRRMIMRNKCRRKLASRNLTAAALAALIRHNYASKLAADTISASVSALFARHRYAQQQSCALLLATVLKRSCARQHYRKQRACLRLQSVVRGHMDREWTRANSSDMKQHRYILACIVKLQATQRGHASRLAVGAVKELNVRIQAAVQAQAFCRQARASRAYGHLLVEQTRMIWATVLQRYWRGALARHHRKYLALLKIQKSAALQVQRVFRGHNGRVLMHERSDELECIHGAIILQTWLRGFMAQARVNAIRHRNACTTAAVSIQAGARGMASRTRARTLHALRRMEKSAIKIQARVRGIQGRQAAARRHEQVVSHREYRTQIAISIQSCYRQHLAKAAYVTAIEERADLEFVKGCCADILQLSVRCFNARNMVRKRKEACMLITALGRGFLSRRKTFKRRQVLEGQELYVAPHKLHPDRYRVPPEQDLKRPAPKSKVRRFRAEARVHERQPSPLPWHVRQRQAVVDFQSKPQIKAFFSDLQEREHAKASTATKTAQQKPKTNKTSTAKTASTSSMSNTAGVTSTKSTVKSVSPVNLLAEKQARPVSATVSRVSGSAAAMPRPATAMPGRLQPPSTSGTGRVPPRFQKVRQNKVGGIGDSGRTRPRARGSDSERNSDEEMPPMPASMATAPKISQPQAPPPAQLQPMPTQPPRALYNKDDISSDPPSDEQRRKKSKDKPKDKPTRATSPEKLAFKKAASTAGPKIEAAFKHCRLGKYHEVELALQEGVQVDSRFGPDNNTMLLACAQNGQKRIAKLLLRNGADMNAPNDKGDTAMHLCYKFNYKELGEYLKSKGADDTIQNAKGQTCYQAQAKK